jgi:hypothetical protein
MTTRALEDPRVLFVRLYEAARRRSAAMLVASGVFMLVAAAALWMARGSAELAAVREMEPAERVWLFDEVRYYSQAVCTEAQLRPALKYRCRESIEFLVAFPECGSECREAAIDARRGDPDEPTE